MPLAGAGAIVEIATVLFAAPLVLGAQVVLQQASRTLVMLYFGLLSLLLLVALMAAAIGLIGLAL